MMSSVHVLHVGCVSSVFLAKQPARDQDQKVVKAYHKGQLQVRHWLNITREVTHLRLLKELGVPGIVELCGTADDTSNVYLVFEPCFGGDLYKRLANHGLLSEAQLCKQVITPLLKVLHSLHQLGIIHRDIKPENIFFQADGTLRLGDFGLAINATRERPISRVGTLQYMAPEVLAQPSADVIALRKVKPTQLPSYDCKVDIWAMGVLVYEALLGVTPFNDADPQAASLKAQFRSPKPLPAYVSPACADFVSQALTKQAAKRPSAVELLGHPWVKQHMTGKEAALLLEQASLNRAGSDGPLSRTSSTSQTTPKGSATVPIALSHVSSNCLPGSSSSSCELSSSAPTASPMVLSTASSFGVGLPWHLPAGPSTGGPPPAALQPASPLPVPKPQPTQTQPQQLPQHPFAAAAAQYSSTRALLGALSTPAPGDVPAASCSAVERHEGGLLHMTAPLAASLPQSDTTASFSRQLSSPARLRHSDLVQDALAPAGDLPGSPPASNSGARLSALAMSPMRALFGAGRNLVRSRSGAAAPAADGCVVGSTAAVSRTLPAQPPVVGFSIRSPLPSPIRGLLQTSRRKPSHASSASSLFAAAQWKPGGGSATGSCSGGSLSLSPQCSGAGCVSSGCGAPKGRLDSPAFLRACSMGPSTVLGAGLVSQGSSGGQGQSDAQAGGRCAAAAVAAVGAHTKQPVLAYAGGSGGSGEQRPAAGQKQQLALLNRYPSAPDPGPLLALSPVRAAGKGMPPPAPVPMDRTGSSGMKGMWLKVQGACRLDKKPKQPLRLPVAQDQDAHCVVSRSPDAGA